MLVDTYLPGMALPAVIPDYQAGARLGTAHLLRLGHRRVALPGRGRAYPFGRQTLEGYGERAGAGAVVHGPGAGPAGRHRGGAGDGGYRSSCALPEPPTALFAVTDAMAIGALRAARERGARVPEDWPWSGMDDIELSGYFDPPLTTVRVAKEEMGRLAAERLIALIEGAAMGGPAAVRCPRSSWSAGRAGEPAGPRPSATAFPAEARSDNPPPRRSA